MTRSVTFNGITQFRPGGITKVNANALAQVSLATNGIIGLVGESDGGTPQTILTLDDPALAKETFRSGPLADAIRPAFEPSNDPRIPGGAFRVLGVRTNSGLQASYEMVNREVSDTAAAGSTPLVINLTTGGLVEDAHIANYLRIGSEVREITDNDASSVTVGVAFSGAPAATTAVEILAPMVTIKSRDYGVHTNQITFEYEPGVSSGQAWTSAFEGSSQISEDLGAKSFLKLAYVGNASRVVLASGTTDGAGSSTEIADSGAAFPTGASDLTGYFAYADAAGTLDVPNIRKIASNTATAITVTNDFLNIAAAPTAPGTSTGYEVRTDQVHTGTAAAGAAASITLEAGISLALNELAGLVVAIVSGTGSGQVRTITSNTAGVSSVVTVDNAWITTPDNTSVYELRYVEAAYATIEGSAGVATALKTYVDANGAGTATLDLNQAFTSNTTLNDLVAAINANASYVAAVPSGVNGLTTLCQTFDFDLGARQVEIRNDYGTITTDPEPSAQLYASTWPNNFRRNLQLLIDDINEKSETVTATRSTGAGAGAGGGRPEYTAVSGAGTPGSSGFVYLTGGTRGTSLSSDFQSAFDLLLNLRCNFVVPLISEDLDNQGLGSTAEFASVAAQLVSHCAVGNGVGKSERGGLLGMKGTLDQVVAQANTLNDADIQLAAQTQRVLDVDGNLKTMDEWVSAVMAAGMRAGAPEVGEPLTHKFLRTFEMDQDSSWDPLDRTDANRLIANGILYAETIQGTGTRWVRDLTTHVKDDNLAFAEGSVRDVVRYVAYNLRTYLEDRFTGVKATPANVGSIRDAATQWLNAANSDNIIVTSLNQDDVLVPGYENLRVNVSGDIARLKVQIYPAVGINFQLSEIFLQLPRLAA
jgi:hypothetical protein